MFWWVFFIIFVVAFLILLIGHYIVKKLNESRSVESVEPREGTSVSTQVSLVIEKGDKKNKIENVNLKQDKRSKSASLISSLDKPTAISDITCSVNTKQVDDGVKTSSSSNLHKRFYNPIEPFPSDKSNMNVAYAKSLTGLNMDLHKLPEGKETMNDNEKVKTSQNCIKILKTNAGLYDKDAIKIENEDSSKLENETISRYKIEKNKYSVKTKESVKNLTQAENNNGVVLKKQKYSIDKSPSILDNANGIRNIETIQPETSSLEIGAVYDTPTQKCDIQNSPATAGDSSELKNTESIKEKLCGRVYGALFGPKQISAKEIYDSPIKIGVANEVENVDQLQRVSSIVIGDIRHMPSEKRELKTTTSQLTTRDAIKEKNDETIQREPSSLFFGAICGTPATPKELMERYEIAFASANNSNINMITDKSVNATGTSSTRAKSSLVNSKENLSTSISRVTFNPETKTSYIESILKETPYAIADFSATKLSDTNSKLNEFTQTKESGISKCTSKVTFAKNTEIVIKDSTSSIANHVCVITPLKIDFTNDSETICSSDFDLDSANNLDSSKDNDKKNPYKRSFINEVVTVPEITYKINSNRLLDVDSDDIYINNDTKSQTSFYLLSENIRGTNVLGQKTQFNSKLPTTSSIPAKGEASTSKSNNTSGYPEVIVVNNKFCGDIKCSRRKLDNVASENKFDNPKSKRLVDKDFELEDNLLQTASLDRFELLTKKGTDKNPKDFKDSD